MIFLASRSGDVIQAFVGLWLVPRYVGPDELGAVLPLQQLAGFFTVPLAIVATVFAKYVNTYATRGEYGKVKCFIRDVILVSAALFLICIVAAHWLIPHFYERLNIAAGSLTMLVLAAGFAGNVSSLFSAALQGLKKFRTMTVQGIIVAPIRLVTLLVAMPFRPLSGYILGQATPPATCSVLAAISLRRDLKPHPIDTTWRKDLPEIWRYLWPYAICTILGTFSGTVIATVYRQRLPEMESAAYYMLMRFADIVGFVGSALGTILFPLASEAHTKGRENRRLLWHSLGGIMAGCLALALCFSLLARPLFSSVAIWRPYLPYAGLLPLITISIGPGLAASAIASYDFACHRFLTTSVYCVLNVMYATLLVCATGIGFFAGILPESLISWTISLNLCHLNKLTYIHIIFNSFTVILLLTLHLRYTSKSSTFH